MAINLSVNLNKVALLRNSRGGGNPSVVVAARACIDAGVQGLTLHWREDERHAKAEDVRDLCRMAKDHGIEFNLEGDQRPELADLAIEVEASQFTLVPVTPGEVTSDHGWDLPKDRDVVAPILERVGKRGIRTAIFMDADADKMELAAETGTQRIEIYTEPYAAAFGTATQDEELERVKATSQAAVRCGLEVNVGHDLDLRNLPILAREVPEIMEASIGHALLADALYLGLPETLRRYLAACRGEDVEVPETA